MAPPTRRASSCSTTSTINQRRKLFLQNPQEGKYIGPLDEFDDGGTSTYHGLQLSIQRRPTRGVSVLSPTVTTVGEPAGSASLV